MIKSHQIVHGSFFLYKGEVVQCSPSLYGSKVVYFKSGGHGVANIDEIRPIPISIDWIEDLGFDLVESKGDFYKYVKKPHPEMSNFFIYLTLTNVEGAMILNFKFRQTEIKYKTYVHELQAAYALTTEYQLN